MIIPRYSLRWLLLLMTVSGVFFYVVTLAVQGSQWAIAVSAAVGGLFVAISVYGVFFGIAWMAAMVTRLARPRHTVPTSPFASAQPPPQFIPPENPE